MQNRSPSSTAVERSAHRKSKTRGVYQAFKNGAPSECVDSQASRSCQQAPLCPQLCPQLCPAVPPAEPPAGRSPLTTNVARPARHTCRSRSVQRAMTKGAPPPHPQVHNKPVIDNRGALCAPHMQDAKRLTGVHKRGAAPPIPLPIMFVALRVTRPFETCCRTYRKCMLVGS